MKIELSEKQVELLLNAQDEKIKTMDERLKSLYSNINMSYERERILLK